MVSFVLRRADAKFCLSNSDYSVAAQIGDHLPGYIDDVTLVLYKRDWRIFVCSLVKQNSSYYQCPNFNWAQKLVRRPPLSDGVGLSVIYLLFERDQNTFRQMKRWRVMI